MSHILQIDTNTNIRPAPLVYPEDLTPPRIKESLQILQNSSSQISPTNASRSGNVTESVIPIHYKQHSDAYIQEKADREGLFNQHNAYDSENNLELDSPKELLDSSLKRKSSLKNLQNLIDGIRRASDSKTKANNKTADDAREAFDRSLEFRKHNNSDLFDLKDDSIRLRKMANTNDSKLKKKRGRQNMSKSAKRGVYSTNDHTEVDFSMNERFATEANREELEEDDLSLSGRRFFSAKNSRETGPIRYSKMSEEEAASMFEIRRKELLSFLKKLGANAALIKRKQNFRNPGVLKNDSDKGELYKAWSGTFKDSVVPNPFIIYQVDSKPAANTGASRSVTAIKESPRRQVNILKGVTSNEMVLEARSRSNGNPRGKIDGRDGTMTVQRNLEATFNKVHENFDNGLESRSVTKKKSPDMTPVKLEDKKEGLESIKIVLKRAVRNTKKKEKVEPEENINEGEKSAAIRRPTPQSEQQIKSARDHGEVKDETSKENKALIQKMREKNQAVLGDIEEIDMLIQRMEADQKPRKPAPLESPKNYGRRETNASPKMADENSNDGYAQAAKQRKGKERPRSMASTPTLVEVPNASQAQAEGQANKKGTETSKLAGKNRVSPHRKSHEHTSTDKKIVEADKKDHHHHKTSIGRSSQEVKPKMTKSLLDDKKLSDKDPFSTKKFVANELNVLKTLSPEGPGSPNIISRAKRVQTPTIMQSLDWGRTGKTTPVLEKTDNRDNRRTEKSKDIRSSYVSSKTTSHNSRAGSQHIDRSIKATTPSSDYASPVKQTQPTMVSPKDNKTQKNGYETELYRGSQGIKNNTKKAYTTTEKRRSLENDSKNNNNEGYARNSMQTKQENSKSPQRISFCDEVKKILKQSSQEDLKGLSSPSASNAMDKSRKILGNKSPHKESERLKNTSNKPKFDFTPSIDIRSKIYRDIKGSEDLTNSHKSMKLSLPFSSYSNKASETQRNDNINMKGSTPGSKSGIQLELGKTSKSWFFEQPFNSAHTISGSTLFESGTERCNLNTQASERSGVTVNYEGHDNNAKLKVKYNELVSQAGRKAARQVENGKESVQSIRKSSKEPQAAKGKKPIGFALFN